MADEYVGPLPNFSDPEKLYFPIALARMNRYGDHDSRSNFGDNSGSATRPPEIFGILNYNGQHPDTEERSFTSFIEKSPFHFIFVGMSRLLFAHPNAPAMIQNRDTFISAGLNRSDNFNAFTGEGTENHINISRTAGYIYASEAAKEPQKWPEASRLRDSMRDWLLGWSSRLYEVGDGEWNSSTYTAVNMAGWFNIFDYTAPSAENDRELHKAARAVLDYYSLTIALHYIQGQLSGAEMRGKTGSNRYRQMSGETDYVSWLWFSPTTDEPPEWRGNKPAMVVYAALSEYRPPAEVVNLASEKFQNAPATYKFSSPSYIMTRPGETRRFLHLGRNYTLGSAAHAIGGWASTTWQVVNWKMFIQNPSEDYPDLLWGNGGYRATDRGNSRNPWDQFAQDGNVLAQLSRVPSNAESIESTIQDLFMQWEVDWNDDFVARWPNPDRGGFPDGQDSIVFQSGDLGEALFSQLYYPSTVSLSFEGDVAFIDAGSTFVAVRSINGKAPSNPSSGVLRDSASRDELFGLIIEVGEIPDYPDLGTFKAAIASRTSLDKSTLAEDFITYSALNGRTIKFSYQTSGAWLEPEYEFAYGVSSPVSLIHEAPWAQPNWPNGAGHGRLPEWSVNDELVILDQAAPLIDGPQVSMVDRVLRIADSDSVYIIDYSGDTPSFHSFPLSNFEELKGTDAEH